MPLDIDPTVDYVFKRLFADPANKDLLIHLLNAVLGLTSPIVDVEILNPFNVKDFAEDKQIVLDIKAQCSDGRHYNIEMQRDLVFSLRQRLAYYCAALFVDQLAEGDDYRQLTPAITICFLTEPLFAHSQVPHMCFRLHDGQQDVTLTDHLQVHTIELTKYNFLREELASSDDLTRWSFFLREAAQLESAELRQLLPQPVFQKATEVVEMIARTPEERREYEARRKAERDHLWRERIARDDGQKQAQLQIVQKLQGMLSLPETSEADLMELELTALVRLRDQLLAKLRPSSS